MKRLPKLLTPLLGAAALAVLGLAGCGDNSADCGPGTHEEKGECLPDGAGGCGPGTVDVDGVCVPDGSMICTQGTVYDEASHTCVLDPSACAPGTVLSNGQCVPEGEMPRHVDLEEAAEPNDTADAPAGTVTLPAIGAPGQVLHGCVIPDGENIDFDAWVVTVDAPTLLKVTSDGVGGLTAGFRVESTDPALVAALWARSGINATGDTAQRQVFLPKAGTYAIRATDSRSLLPIFPQPPASGGEGHCYYMTVEQVAIPAAEPVTLDDPDSGTVEITDSIGGDVKFYSIDAREGDIIDALLTIPHPAAEGALVALAGGAYRASGVETVDFFGPLPAEAFFAGLRASDEVLIAVDTTFNYATQPAEFQLLLNYYAGHALATAPVTVTQRDGVLDNLNDVSYFYVDVGDVHLFNVDVTFSSPANYLIFDQDGFIRATGTVLGFGALAIPGTAVGHDNGWFQVATPGRYYLAVFNPSLAEGETFTVSGTSTTGTPEPLTVGTPITNHPQPATNATFLSFDRGTTDWVSYTATATGFGGSLALQMFDPTAAGRFDVDIAPVIQHVFPPDTHGRIVIDDPQMSLLRVVDTGTPGASATFNLDVEPRLYTDLGEVSEAMPRNADNQEIAAAGERKLYLVKAQDSDTVTIKVTPEAGFDAQVRLLDVDEGDQGVVNDSGAGADEHVSLSGSGWVAFEVTAVGAPATGHFNVQVSAVAPILYDISAGTLPFVDICPGSTPIMTDQDDLLTPPIDLPASWSFELFGQAVTSYRLTSNGFISFQPGLQEPDPADNNAAFYNNAAIPVSADPNGIIAPYWDDLEHVTVCSKEDGNTLTLQWTGDLYGTARTQKAAFQIVLHNDTKVIDFIYGADQEADGGGFGAPDQGATVGVEGLTGTFGHQIVFNTPNVIHPNTSRTLTPAP